MDDREQLLLPTELNVEGTCFDPEYMLRLKRNSEVGLWVWAHEPYWDWLALKGQDYEWKSQRRKAAPIAEGGPELIEQAKEEAFFAWGL